MSLPQEVLDVLHYDGVVILPTETVYGLAARADRPEAVQRLYDIKGRDPQKPLTLCVDDMQSAKLYAKFCRKATSLAKKFWPGPLTLVLRAADPDFFNRLAPKIYGTNKRGEPTIAIRCPDTLWRDKIHHRGTPYPVALTSANKSGEEAPVTAQMANKALGLEVDAIWLGAECELGQPSTIITLAEETPKVLREGALPTKAFKRWDIS